MKWLLIALLCCFCHRADAAVIGSKAFTEGFLLSEYIAQEIEPITSVERRFGLGGTGVLITSLNSNEIQLYVEYTGTIAEEILKRPGLANADLPAALDRIGLVMSPSLGFNNTYAIAVTKEFARAHGLRTISDFKRAASVARIGMSHEFIERSDGWRALLKAYSISLDHPVQGMEHSLAYEAIAAGRVDAIDVYSTDAKIEKLQLVVLEDDRRFFPSYEAVVLARKDFASREPEVWKRIGALAGRIDEPLMRKLNARVDIDHKPYREVIGEQFHPERKLTDTRGSDFWQRTREHLLLVGLALLFSIVVGVPLGIFATSNRWLGQAILLTSGTVQTIPSLALLCFLIPLFGIGTGSALAALCLYGLLPIVMNTYLGLQSIDTSLVEMIRALRLTRWQALVRIRLPLASPSILAGIRTSTVIGIGTATLAALIGAGGYGATIVAGLAVNDMNLILAGAIPAAAMALVAHGLFEIIERFVVPRGLRL